MDYTDKIILKTEEDLLIRRKKMTLEKLENQAIYILEERNGTQPEKIEFDVEASDAAYYKATTYSEELALQEEAGEFYDAEKRAAEADETIKAFSPVLKELNLETAKDKNDLKLLLEQIQSLAEEAESRGQKKASFQEGGFFKNPKEYKDSFDLDLDNYEFETKPVLDFFGLKNHNTVRVKIVVKGGLETYGFLVNSEHEIVDMTTLCLGPNSPHPLPWECDPR